MTVVNLNRDEKIMARCICAYVIAPRSMVPGELFLTNQRIFWKMTEINKQDISFDLDVFDDIQSVKEGTLIIYHRITVMDKEGENYIFDLAERKSAKAFVRVFNDIKKDAASY